VRDHCHSCFLLVAVFQAMCCVSFVFSAFFTLKKLVSSTQNLIEQNPQDKLQTLRRPSICPVGLIFRKYDEEIQGCKESQLEQSKKEKTGAQGFCTKCARFSSSFEGLRSIGAYSAL
jgi:hypothetical protein